MRALGVRCAHSGTARAARAQLSLFLLALTSTSNRRLFAVPLLILLKRERLERSLLTRLRSYIVVLVYSKKTGGTVFGAATFEPLEYAGWSEL